MTVDDAARHDWQRWCQDRDALVTGVPGNLALITYQAVDAEPTAVDQVEGAIAWRDPAEPGVRLSLPGPATLHHPGAGTRQLTTDEPDVLLERLRPDGGPLLRLGSQVLDAFSLDGSDYELRIYDDHAPALQRFAGIERYTYDPAAVLTARFERRAQDDAVAWDFTRTSDAGHTKTVPGTLVLELDGPTPSTHELLAFADGPELVLVFADATSGVESYAPGRFLRLPLPRTSGTVELDLNRAFIPPCGFSAFYSCPIPPPTNRLPIPVRAGERQVRWHDQEDEHVA